MSRKSQITRALESLEAKRDALLREAEALTSAIQAIQHSAALPKAPRKARKIAAVPEKVGA